MIASPPKCCYCQICALACSFQMTGEFSLSGARIRVLESKRGHGVPIVCLQCPTRPCIDACPVGALRSFEGVVRVDENLCTACGACAKACPIEAIRIFNKKAAKCELCSLDPPCVRYCPTEALTIGELTDADREEALKSMTQLVG